jgi:pimeloyl-ACP methyl ester carboxylesterase
MRPIKLAAAILVALAATSVGSALAADSRPALEVASLGDAPAEAQASAAPTAAGGSFARLVRIDGGRRLFLTCRGNGGPTVVLISGFRGAYDDWNHVVPRTGAAPRPSPGSVLPRVGRFTRVCAYDRPGTVDFDGDLAPSTPVRQPTTAADDVDDLRALLAAAKVPGPYVLVAHSWGGMSAYLYASRYPEQVAGLVLLDAGSVFLKTALKPLQWKRFVRGGRTPGKPKTLEAVDYERSVTEILAGPPVPRVPSVVLTSDHPFDFGAGPGTWPAWRRAQNRLAAALAAKHLANTNSGHYIAGERPSLVVGQVRSMVRALRTGAGR